MHWSKTEKRNEVLEKIKIGWKNLENRPCKKNGQMIICTICKTEKYIKLALIKRGVKHCSAKCANASRKGKMPTNLKLAQLNSPIGKKGINYFHARKEKHWNWKGGITPINKALRESLEYEEWRKAVFERDLYTCVNCFVTGGKLEADHIKPFSLYPDLRFELSNGRTLCHDCHLLIGWNLFREKNPSIG